LAANGPLPIIYYALPSTVKAFAANFGKNLSHSLTSPAFRSGLLPDQAVQSKRTAGFRPQYRFHRELCGEDAVVPGSDAGPHAIVRAFDLSRTAASGSLWRYEIVKHGICAWMDWAAEGYVADSAGLGFSPW